MLVPASIGAGLETPRRRSSSSVLARIGGRPTPRSPCLTARTRFERGPGALPVDLPDWRKAADPIRSAGAPNRLPTGAGRPAGSLSRKNGGERVNSKSHALRHRPLSRRRQAALLVHSPIGRDGRTRTCILRHRRAALIRLSYVTVGRRPGLRSPPSTAVRCPGL